MCSARRGQPEAGADVQRTCGGRGVADLQAARASLRQPIKPGGGHGTGQTAPVVCILDSHRLHQPHLGGRVEPEERLAGDLTIGSLDREIETGVVERALPQPGLDRFAASSSHRMRLARRFSAIDEHEPFRQRGDVGPVASVHPGDPVFVAGDHEAGSGQQTQQLDVVVTGEYLDRVGPRASIASTARAHMIGSETADTPGTMIGSHPYTRTQSSVQRPQPLTIDQKN